MSDHKFYFDPRLMLMVSGPIRKNCDFCGGENAQYRFPCQDFWARTPDGERVILCRGDWFSCSACEPYVFQKEIGLLADLVIQRKSMPANKWRYMVHLWGQFQSNRTSELSEAINKGKRIS